MREIDVKGKSEEELSQSKSSQEDKLRRKRVSWFSARTWESPPHFIPSRCGDSTTSRCPRCSAWRLRSRIVGAPCFCRPSIGAVLTAVARETVREVERFSDSACRRPRQPITANDGSGSDGGGDCRQASRSDCLRADARAWSTWPSLRLPFRF